MPWEYLQIFSVKISYINFPSHVRIGSQRTRLDVTWRSENETSMSCDYVQAPLCAHYDVVVNGAKHTRSSISLTDVHNTPHGGMKYLHLSLEIQPFPLAGTSRSLWSTVAVHKLLVLVVIWDDFRKISLTPYKRTSICGDCWRLSQNSTLSHPHAGKMLLSQASSDIHPIETITLS